MITGRSKKSVGKVAENLESIEKRAKSAEQHFMRNRLSENEYEMQGNSTIVLSVKRVSQKKPDEAEIG